MSGNGTPRHWRKDGEWKYPPTKLVVSTRPDPLQLPETAGEVSLPQHTHAAQMMQAAYSLRLSYYREVPDLLQR